MGRMFIAPIQIAATTTQIDILELIAPAAGAVVVYEALVTTTIETDANEVQMELEVVRFTGTYTSGSGGTTATGRSLGLAGATEDSATVETGNTTQAAVGTGTLEVLSAPYMNNRLGFHYLPIPEARPTIAATDAFAIQLQAAPASTGFGGHVIYEELVS